MKAVSVALFCLTHFLESVNGERTRNWGALAFPAWDGEGNKEVFQPQGLGLGGEAPRRAWQSARPLTKTAREPRGQKPTSPSSHSKFLAHALFCFLSCQFSKEIHFPPPTPNVMTELKTLF